MFCVMQLVVEVYWVCYLEVVVEVCDVFWVDVMIKYLVVLVSWCGLDFVIGSIFYVIVFGDKGVFVDLNEVVFDFVQVLQQYVNFGVLCVICCVDGKFYGVLFDMYVQLQYYCSDLVVMVLVDWDGFFVVVCVLCVQGYGFVQ